MANNAAEQYIEDVLSGKQVACRWVRLAAERHKKDLEASKRPGAALRYDTDAAAKAISFFGLLQHWKGDVAGKRFALEPWQEFIIASIFGWLREDGTRRFRTAMIACARKQGKTSLAAGIGLYLLVADGEPGAWGVVAATKRDQARIAHNDMVQMVKRSPQLRKEIGIVRDNLHHPASSSRFEPLGKDADTTAGLDLSAVICDELYAWKDPELWDILATATAARRQPLMLSISTAGYDQQSLFFQQWSYTESVLMGTVEDDSHFGIIYTLDEDDDPFDESVWKKAQPNLGVSSKLDEIRRLAAQAQEMPARRNAFERLYLNRWTQSETRFLDQAAWDACDLGPVDEAALEGRRCFGGLDLSATKDLTSYALVFEPAEPGGAFDVLVRIFIPEDTLRQRVKADRAPYDVWARENLVYTTSGNTVDYNEIMYHLAADAQRFRMEEMAFDRWNSSKLITDLQEQEGFRVDPSSGSGPTLVQFGQGYRDMSQPTKELERLVLERKISHGGNKALAWQVGNLVIEQDAAGNYKPSKLKSRERIDSCVALIMALSRALAHGPKKSVYDTRGLRTL